LYAQQDAATQNKVTDTVWRMFQEVMHQVISAVADPQLCDSESLYLGSGVDVQQAGVALIEQDHVDVAEQKVHIAADLEGTRFMCVCARVLYLHAEIIAV
jgi:hypothetical protein